MKRKNIEQSYLPAGKGFNRIMVAVVFTCIYICVNLLVAPVTYAAGMPGGTVSNPAVRAVDIAKPAVVRIITTLGGRLTVSFTGANPVTFPLNGSTYKMQLFGSGAFITAHGDILTAGHVVNPPHDVADSSFYELAAQDVADYYNSTHPTQFVTAIDVFTALSDGTLRSHSQYDTPTSRVYLSTDYTGTTNVTSVDNMPPETYADVDKILQQSDFLHQDTAIVHVPKTNTPSIQIGDSTNVAQQDQLTIIGFPANGDVPASNNTTDGNPATGFFASSVNRVYVSAIKQNDKGSSLIQIGGNVEHGDSGGPALDDNGNIMGVVSFGGLDQPDGTSFLQASNSAQQFVKDLQLDTRPGAFQTAWSQAVTTYSSTDAGHWHQAQLQLQKLQNNYPDFHAVRPFLNYANTQASQENAINTIAIITNPLFWIAIIVIAFAVILVLLLTRRKKTSQPAFATQPSPYQPAYDGNTSLNMGTNPNMQPAQLGSMQSVSQIPQTPTPVPQLAERYEQFSLPRSQELGDGQFPAQRPPVQPTPVAPYNAAQSGQLPVMPNQPPMSPWPQPMGYGAAPAYGQPSPYSQQPYNAAQPSRPLQGMSNPLYPSQQPQYAPYPPPATPWSSTPSHTPPSSMASPYAAPNLAQQGEPTPRRQPSSALYGMPNSQQPVQNSGALPVPVQPQRQASAPLNSDTSTTSDDATVRVNQQNQTGSDETAKPIEDKESTSPSAPGQADVATILNEANAATYSSEE